MSRAERFDRVDFAMRYPERTPASIESPEVPVAPDASRATPAPSDQDPMPRIVWPIERLRLRRVGESVRADRDGKGRPHKGIDLFANAGTEVRAAAGGQVLRVVDGRKSPSLSQRRAGLFLDMRGSDALIYRYLHLGAAQVEPGAFIPPGQVIGTVAAPFTSGLAETPHLHFEIRQGDFDRNRQDYGAPVDPLRRLPPLRA